MTPRETKLFFLFRDAQFRAGYCYLRFPPDFFSSVDWGLVGAFFGERIASLSGMVLTGFRVRHSWTISGKNNTDADPAASRMDIARMVFSMTDGEFRGISVPCYPPSGGSWRYTTELDTLASSITSNSVGIYRKSNQTRAWFDTYQGAYHGIEFFENKGDKKWTK